MLTVTEFRNAAGQVTQGGEKSVWYLLCYDP